MKTFSLTFLEPDFKILVVHRRLFEKDRPRFFIGVVDAFNEATGLLKVTGYSIGLARAGGLSKKREPRTKILSLTAGTLIVYQLPISVDVTAATIELDKQGNIHLTDRKFEMDLSEAHGVD